MLQDHVMDKLQYFDEKKYEIRSDKVLLLENKDKGEVELECVLERDTLVIQAPDKSVFSYLGENKGDRSCPDCFLYVLEEDGAYSLHIMEYKKTINTENIKKSKIQFIMGIYNARAIAGFLNISIKKIHIYSAFRNDTIGNLSQSDSIVLRSANIDEKNRSIIRDWRNGICKLMVDLNETPYTHNKICLDENGKGTCRLVN